MRESGWIEMVGEREAERVDDRVVEREAERVDDRVGG